jgi:hypothetical protein
MWNMNIPYAAFEDGPDKGFRNVGKTQSDAGEIPKRTYTIFRTRQKFEIKNLSIVLLVVGINTCLLFSKDAKYYCAAHENEYANEIQRLGSVHVICELFFLEMYILGIVNLPPLAHRPFILSYLPPLRI